MGDRDAVSCSQAAEIVPLHGSGEPLADTGADDIDKLASEEILRCLSHFLLLSKLDSLKRRAESVTGAGFHFHENDHAAV